MHEILFDTETWVALAFVLFVAGLGYIGVHRMIAKALDERAGRIKAELDEARKLKDDAAQLLAEYRQKREQAESEAQEIIAGAKAEAERLAIEAKSKMEEFVSRRNKLAELKIAQAEAQRRRRSRGRRRRQGARPGDQGAARRRIDRQGHRRHPQKAELTGGFRPPLRARAGRRQDSYQQAGFARQGRGCPHYTFRPCAKRRAAMRGLCLPRPAHYPHVE